MDRRNCCPGGAAGSIAALCSGKWRGSPSRRLERAAEPVGVLRGSMRPAAGVTRAAEEAPLRVSRQQLRDDAHRKLHRHIAAPALPQLRTKPSIDLLIARLQAE